MGAEGSTDDHADKAERLLRNLARRLDQEAPGVAASILEGLDEMLTVNRLGLPAQLRRSLACTNSDREHDGDRTSRLPQREAMAKSRDGTALDRCLHVGGHKGFRRLKAYKHLPVLRAALAHLSKYFNQPVEHNAHAA